MATRLFAAGFSLPQTCTMHEALLLLLVIAAGIAIYHFYLIRQRERAPCFKAFLHNNWLGACVFTGIVLDYFLE